MLSYLRGLTRARGRTSWMQAPASRFQAPASQSQVTASELQVPESRWHVDASSLWLGVSAVLFVTLALTVWLIIRPAPHGVVVGVDNIVQFAGPLLLIPLCFRGIRPALRRRGPHLVPALLGLSILAWVLGQLTWTFYEQVLHTANPFPSFADVGYLLQYPFLSAAVLLLPVRRLSVVGRTRLLLDGLMIVVAAVTFSWYFILGPTILQGGESTLAKVVGTLYPLWDIVILACVVFMLALSRYAQLKRAIATLAIGMTTVVLADCIFDYQTLHNTFATGGVADIGWVLGDMLICLSAGMTWLALTSREGIRERRASVLADPGEIDTPPAWRSLIPYALLPAVGALVIYTSQVRGDEQLQPGVYVGGAALLLTIFLRQVLSILENRRLYDRLHLAFSELGSKNSALTDANQRLQTLATTDPLTELPNQRALVSAIEQELERGRRYGRYSSVLFMDLDHFKKVNDVFGHSAGDAVLRESAFVMRATLRTVDILGRWGGEEFVAILPEVDSRGALIVAERLRDAIAAHTFVSAPCHLTASIGAASYPDDGDSRTTLVDAADRAMYAAKHLGRDLGRAADDPLVEPTLVEGDVVVGNASLTHTVEGLSAMIGGRAHYTEGHTSSVATLATKLATAMNLESGELAAVKLAARLHDIGKVAVPDAVLLKPGRLNDDEWMLMRRHPIVGADVVGRIHGLGHLAPIIRSHHERWDGVGYPDGLSGEEIPLGARILAVADAYEAMTTGRVYQEARDPDWALSELKRCAGSQFDPRVVETMTRVLSSETPTPFGSRRAG